MRSIHRDIAGIIILSNDNQILLCKSYAGGAYANYWIIPGGGVDEGETKLEAAIRETIEEVGIDITPFDMQSLDLILTDEREKTLRDTNERVLVRMTFYTFVVRANKSASEIPAQCNDDITEAVWHSLDSLRSLNIPPTTQMALKSLDLL